MFAVHFMFHKARSVDEDWVAERADDLRSKSYDASHIDSIREGEAPSIKPEGERAPPAAKR